MSSAQVWRPAVTSDACIVNAPFQRRDGSLWASLLSSQFVLAVNTNGFFFNRSKHICGWQIVGYCSIASKVHLRAKRSSYPLDLWNNVRKTRWKFHRESLENFLWKMSLVIFFISKKMHREYIFNLSSNIGQDLTRSGDYRRAYVDLFTQKIEVR